MSYSAFLMISSQLSTRRKGLCQVQDSSIKVEENHGRDSWVLSTKVFDSDGCKVPSFLKNNLASMNVFRWQQKGAYLKIGEDGQSVYLQQDIKALNRYVAFRAVMSDFVQVANEWKTILQDA